jgi:hypothetical protein
LPDVDDAGIAIKGLPSTAIKIGNPSKKLNEKEIKNYLKVLGPKDLMSCPGTNKLYFGRRYGPRDGHEIAEVFVGVPEYESGAEKNKIL